jgi:hypothetical protein
VILAFQVDVEVLDDRLRALAERVQAKPYNKKKNAVVHQFHTFLQQCDNLRSLENAQPVDIRRFLAWKDLHHGKTQVHKISCQYLGKVGVSQCDCPIRLASGSVANIISQLKSYFQGLGCGTEWNLMSGTGNPVAAKEVQDYHSGVKDEQAEAHILPKQAKPLFLGKLNLLCQYWHNELTGYLHRIERFIILRDRAFFTLQFFAGDRAHDLSYLVGQEVRVLSDKTGIYIRLTYGKTLCGENHNDFVVPRCDDTLVCPIEALNEYSKWSKSLGVNLEHGYVFRLVSNGKISNDKFNANSAYKQLKTHLRAIGQDDGETPHSFRAGNSISLLLGGVNERSIMSHVGWRSTETFTHYSRKLVFQSKEAASCLASQAKSHQCQSSACYDALDHSKMTPFF